MVLAPGPAPRMEMQTAAKQLKKKKKQAVVERAIWEKSFVCLFVWSFLINNIIRTTNLPEACVSMTFQILGILLDKYFENIASNRPQSSG